MEPAIPLSNSSFSDNDKKNLERLRETFGSVVSLEDISSAYHQSGCNLYTAGDILCNLQRITSKSSKLTSEEEFNSTNSPSLCSSDNCVKMAQDTKSKPRKSPACMGTVSSVIGRGYVVPKTSTKGSCKPKSLILNSDDIPIPQILDEKDFQNTTEGSDTMHQDIEEFLFRMLGEGFSLNMSVIQDIVGNYLFFPSENEALSIFLCLSKYCTGFAGQCGYDVTKVIDTVAKLQDSFV